MTREYFEETDFYNVMEKLKQETDNIITLEELQQLAIEALENGDWTYAKHLIDALYNGCDEDIWNVHIKKIVKLPLDSVTFGKIRLHIEKME